MGHLERNWFGYENNVRVLKLTMKLHRPVNPSSDIATHFCSGSNSSLTVNVHDNILTALTYLIGKEVKTAITSLFKDCCLGR